MIRTVSTTRVGLLVSFLLSGTPARAEQHSAEEEVGDVHSAGPTAAGSEGSHALTALSHEPMASPHAHRDAPALTPSSALMTHTEAEELRLRGIRSLAELLDMEAPGYHLTGEISNGWLVGGRGLSTDSSARILMMRDGMALNRRIGLGYPGGGWASALLGDLRRVDVATGPGSFEHGSGAVDGFINLVSANGRSHPGLRIEADQTLGTERRLEMSAGHVLPIGDGLDVFLYGGYADAKGERAMPLASVEFDEAASDDALGPWVKHLLSWYRYRQLYEAYLRPHWKGTLRLHYGGERSRISGGVLVTYHRASMNGFGAIHVRSMVPGSTDNETAYRALRDIHTTDTLGAAMGLQNESLLIASPVTLRFSEDETLEFLLSFRRENMEQRPVRWLLAEEFDWYDIDREQGPLWWRDLIESEGRMRAVLQSTSISHTRLRIGAEAAYRQFDTGSQHSLSPTAVDSYPRDNIGLGAYGMNRLSWASYADAQVELGPLQVVGGARLAGAGKLSGTQFVEGSERQIGGGIP